MELTTSLVLLLDKLKGRQVGSHENRQTGHIYAYISLTKREDQNYSGSVDIESQRAPARPQNHLITSAVAMVIRGIGSYPLLGTSPPFQGPLLSHFLTGLAISLSSTGSEE